MSSPHPTRRVLLLILCQTLIVPLAVLGFFLLAPMWYESKEHASFRSEIMASPEIPADKKGAAIEFYDRVDIREVCFHCPPDMEDMRASFDASGVTATFERLRWGQLLSFILVALLTVALVAILILNSLAGKSSAALIRSYRVAWSIGIAAAVLKLILLIPLLTYGFFELTVLASDHYYPKVLIFIVIGGLIGLWACIASVLRKVPLEFTEPMALELTAAQAPRLWEVVHRAAERLQTAPPDRIIVGTQLNFYVTELAVVLETGRVEGRTLYLSQPLLKQFSEQEVVAIIGHELGHFRGEDTRLTREFYPLKFKVNATLQGLTTAGLIGWPSLGLLNFFSYSFENTIQRASRAREILADQCGADLTSASTLGRALVKFQVFHETFQRLLRDAANGQVQNPLEIAWHSYIRTKILPEDAFWPQLFTKEMPHPLDSHPPLHVRLEALGDNVSLAEARTIAMEEVSTAYAAWFPHGETLFSDLSRKVEEEVRELQRRTKVVKADATTEEGKALLATHFPDVYWSREVWRGTVGAILFSLLFVAGGVLAILFNTMPVLWFFYVPLGSLFLYAAIFYWKTRRDGLRVTAESITHEGWKRTLRFDEIGKLNFQNVNGKWTVSLHLKERQPALKKWTPPLPVKQINLGLSGYDSDGQVIAEIIHRYYYRQIP